MTQTEYKKTIENELDIINEIIDKKIEHRKSYKKEARIHKRLVVELRKFEPKKWQLSKALSYMTLF